MAPWWIPSQVEAAVTRKFVVSQLVPEEIEKLDSAVGFGSDSLTDRTYWDSIQSSAKRFFLILVDLNIPDQIFAIIDDGWDDGELPLSLEDIDRLQLTASRDERMDRRFHQRQFQYIVRPIERGNNVAYGDHEVVPLDLVDRGTGLANKAQQADKVKIPNGGNLTFSRRRYQLRNGPEGISQQDFLDFVRGMKSVQNEHIISFWASYTHQGFGYVLISPCNDFTLKSLLANTPSSVKGLSKRARRELIMNWILCLVDTMCYLHRRNRSHCCIKPSTVLFNSQNCIFFADVNRLNSETLVGGHTDKSSFDREWYDYAAPEQWYRPSAPTPSSPPSRMGPLAMSTSPENGSWGASRAIDPSNSPTSVLHGPNPELNPQHADIFSLACVILELLSLLLKRSTSKFASCRSAKHKTAGRGGAVLDTSFHKNLGQVESWMSDLAKDATKKAASSMQEDGSIVFRGVVPMLHVITGMLSMNPWERPSAIEIQQQIYQILTEHCGILEPHCVHQYGTADIQYGLGRMAINGTQDQAILRQPAQPSFGYGMTPRTFRHGRTNSSGGYSQNSRTSSNTTASSEREEDMMYAARSGMSSPHPIRTPAGWSNGNGQQYMGNGGNQASLFAQ